MEKATFEAFIGNLCAYFDHKDPSDRSIEEWFSEVKCIPDNAIDRIYTELKKESWPRNLPAAMRAIYHQEDGQGKIECECRFINEPGKPYGRWEVAKWSEADESWFIYSFPCGCVPGGIHTRNQLLARRLYEGKEYDRHQAQLPSWALVYPDEAGLHKMTAPIKDMIRAKRQKDSAGMIETEIEAVKKAKEENQMSQIGDELPF